MGERALTGNAADPKQVRFAERKERDRDRRYRAALRAVMRSPGGRAFVWELLTKTGLYASPVGRDNDETNRNIGRGDFGRELVATCVANETEMYLLMEREARAWQQGEDREVDAVHTESASEDV